MKYQNGNIFRITFTILFLGFMSASITYAESYSFVKQWGSYGTDNGQFYSPQGVAVDSTGNVYVTDWGNNCIEKFDSNGNFITKWGSQGSGDGQFGLGPNGIAVDSSGNVYVTDHWNNRIEKFDKNGKYLMQWGTLSNPIGVATDSSGNVYVADKDANCIQKFNSNGVLIKTWLSSNPYYIAIDSANYVYVIAFFNNIVQKYDTNGNYLMQWGTPGSGNGQFDNTNGVAVDSSGNVYVTDFGNHRVEKFDSNGNFITKWGSFGSDPGQFEEPYGIAVDSSGNVYVADSGGNPRIEKFAPTQSPIIPVASFTSGVTTGDVPLTVQFTDQSTGTPTSWEWNFGDGETSTEPNPTHVYDEVGGYTVTLIVKNDVGSNKTSKEGYVLVETDDIPLYPAHFSADITSGKSPLTVIFHDDDEKGPSGIGPIWREWNFGDGTVVNYPVDNNESASPYATHTYTEPGNYTVMLYMDNRGGHSLLTKYNYITVIGSVKPVASFAADKISGVHPLNVNFTDGSTGSPTSWYWDFGDGNYSTVQNPMHTYSAAGNYTVNLTVSNANGRDSKTLVIIVQKEQSEVTILPVADFNANPTSGTAPLTVQFTDSSQNAVGWSWSFGDGATLNDQNPSYTYSTEGTYNVNLVVSNANGTASKSATITVQSSSSDGSSGGSSHSSGGSGAGGSPEPQSNVEAKELSQTFIASGQSVKFNFPQKATPVIYVGFDSKKTAGKTTTIVEMLKGKSTLVSGLPSDEIYKYVNIWVGNAGFGDSKNIKNSVVNFKVEKSWIKSNNIDKSSIKLNRYNISKWDQLATSLSEEDDNFLYLTAQTPGFSPFAITGKTTASGAGIQLTTGNKTRKETNTGNTSANTEQIPEQNAIHSAPAFESVFGVAGLLAVFLYRKK